MPFGYVTHKKTYGDCTMCYSWGQFLVTMATTSKLLKAEFALSKRVSIWLYEYDIHSVMYAVHLTKIFDYPACAISTQIQSCYCITNQRGQR